MSRKRKRRRASAEEDPDDDVDGTEEWLLSIAGVYVFLHYVRGNRRFKCEIVADGKVSRATALLRTFLEWPTTEFKVLAFKTSRGDCEVLLDKLNVDFHMLSLILI